MTNSGSQAYKLIGLNDDKTHAELWAEEDGIAIERVRQGYNAYRVYNEPRPTRIGEVVATMKLKDEGKLFRLVRLPNN